MTDVITTKEFIKEQWGTNKRLIKEVLKEEERARNDDRWMMFKALQKLGFNITFRCEGINWFIPENEFRDVPNFETFRRVRQEIQNKDGEFLPTDPQVLIRRRIKQEAIREYYSGDRGKVAEYEVEVAEVQDGTVSGLRKEFCGCGRELKEDDGFRCKFCVALEELKND